VVFAWSNDHDNYAGGIMTTGRAHTASRKLVKRDETVGAILAFTSI